MTWWKRNREILKMQMCKEVDPSVLNYAAQGFIHFVQLFNLDEACSISLIFDSPADVAANHFLRGALCNLFRLWKTQK